MKKATMKIVRYTVTPEDSAARLAFVGLPGWRFVRLERKGVNVRVYYEKEKAKEDGRGLLPAAHEGEGG